MIDEFLQEKREVWLEEWAPSERRVYRDSEGEFIRAVDPASEHGEQTVKVYLPKDLQEINNEN